ncbi:hypothetical protein VTN77DRAFT_351 [Rasamsonia byssochlamydoides]|uniref:uncharacterized protein n=1 Tax=Rasamsonia byssochlamydoides TaxID=89139 RepID=UPI0037444C03
MFQQGPELESNPQCPLPTASSLQTMVIKDGQAPEEQLPKQVRWDGDDELNPMNWKQGKKWRNLAVISMMTFVTPIASSMFAPGVPQAMKEFHSTSTVLGTFVISVYVLGQAFGPLFTAPLS